MQILGSLIELSNDPASLPLPWWYRAPLGLLSGTPVFVALVRTSERPVGDLVVTVLDPMKWQRMVSVQCEELDEPGLIGRVFDSVYPLNIAIAEAVTVETGDKHQVSLICEPYGGDSDVDGDGVAEQLRSHGFTTPDVQPFLKKLPPILWHDTDQVDHGWLRRCDWLQQVMEHYPEASSAVDLTKAVVSADTEKRILRFVFPKKGAITVEIEHADKPGALKAIANAFLESKINVLSGLLRRGGAKPRNAVLIAICEPIKSSTAEEIRQTLEGHLRQVPEEFRAKPTIYEGKPTSEVIYPRHPQELVARVPTFLLPTIQESRRQIPKGHIPIFISRRFLSGERRNRIVARVRKVLHEQKCHPVEALPEPADLNTALMEVSAQMWLSKAGIVLVAGGSDDSFNMNLAYETGFLQGQGKPVLILVERGSDKSLYEWSIAHGIIAPRFPDDSAAFDPDNPESLDALISQWILNRLRPRR